MDFLTPKSINEEIHKKTLEISIKISVIIFLFISIYSFSLQFRQQQHTIQSKLNIDNDFMLNALKIGDFFFVTRYTSSFVETGTVNLAGVKQNGEEDWISVFPDKQMASSFKPNGFSLSLFGVFVHGRHLIKGQGEYEWEFFYRYQIGYIFLIQSLLISLIFAVFIFFSLRYLLRNNANYFAKPIAALSADLSAQSDVTSGLSLNKYSESLKYRETEEFVGTLKSLISKITMQQEELKEVEVLKALNKLSRQVNHDIQSPLGALKTAVSTLPQKSEKHTSLINRSIERIEAIVSDLKLKNTAPKKQTDFEKVDLVQFLGALVEEKSIEYKDQDAIIDFSSNIESVFYEINHHDFSRAISNIINNGIEAVESKTAQIKVQLEKNEKEIIISISDNGPGIPKDIQDKIFDYGFTYGKPNGSGTGLAQASKTIFDLSGEIKIKKSSVYIYLK